MSKQGWKHCCLPGHWSPKLIKKRLATRLLFVPLIKVPWKWIEEVEEARFTLSEKKAMKAVLSSSLPQMVRGPSRQYGCQSPENCSNTRPPPRVAFHEMDFYPPQCNTRNRYGNTSEVLPKSRKPSLRNQNQLMNFAKNHKEGIAAAMCIR